MRYRVRVYSHPFWEDIKSTVAVVKGVTKEELSGVISRYMLGDGVRAIVEDEAPWVEIEKIYAKENDA